MFKTLHAVSIVYFIVSGALSGLAKLHLVSTSTVPVKLHFLHLHIFLKKSLKVAVTFKIKYTKLTKSKCSLSTIGVIKSVWWQKWDMLRDVYLFMFQSQLLIGLARASQEEP